MKRTSVTALAVCMSLCVNIEYSNAQNNIASPNLDVTTTPVVIEPKARELLRQMSAAYNQLRSFSCEVRSQQTSGKLAIRATSRVQWQRPKRVAVEHYQRFSNWPKLIHKRLVADEKHVFIDYEGRGEYKGMLDDGSSSSRNLVNILSNVTSLLEKKDMLQLILSENQRILAEARIRSVNYGGVAVIDGAPYDRIDLKSKVGTSSFFLDRRTHLVRRTFSSYKGDSIGNEAGSGVANYLNVRLNPRLSSKVFQLPHGSRVNDVAPVIAMRELEEESRLTLPNFNDVKVESRANAKARALVAQMLQTMQNLNSFQGVLTSGLNQRVEIAWQYPNQFRLRNDASYGNLRVTQAVSDGKTVSRLLQNVVQPIEYSKQDVSPKFGEIVDPFKPAEIFDAGFPDLLTKSSLIMRKMWLDAPMITLGKPQNFDGVRVQTVIIGENSKDENGQPIKIVSTLLIGERDHLLRLYERQDNASWRQYGFVQRSRQTFTRVRTNQMLPASLFRFMVPRGAKLVKPRFPLEKNTVLREARNALRIKKTGSSTAASSPH